MQVMQLLRIVWDALDHSGMKYPKLIVHCHPVQSAEHFAFGLYS